MPCTVVVGGQYGSEGKGKVVSLIARTLTRPWVVRCGGPNSGHTTVVGKREVVLRQLPAGVSNPEATLLISAGCAVDPDILIAEADALSVDRDRVIVDPRAVVVTSAERTAEEGAMRDIGSTGSGTGAALIRRIRRDSAACLVEESPALRRRFRIERVAPLLHAQLDLGQNLIVEGTQGFGLSLLHGPHYPFVTGRDTTASGFAAEVGLAPRDVTHVLMVVRTFPIRVGGVSGPLLDEITWDEVRTLSGAPRTVPELTSVTKKLRRVAHFDWTMFRAACRHNRPTGLAVMGLDRLDYANTGVTRWSDLTSSGRSFLARIESSAHVPIEWVGTGFSTDEAFAPTLAKDNRDAQDWRIDRREDRASAIAARSCSESQQVSRSGPEAFPPQP